MSDFRLKMIKKITLPCIKEKEAKKNRMREGEAVRAFFLHRDMIFYTCIKKFIKLTTFLKSLRFSIVSHRFVSNLRS